MDAFDVAVADLAERCATDPDFAAEVEVERERLRKQLATPGMSISASRFNAFVLMGVRPRQGQMARET